MTDKPYESSKEESDAEKQSRSNRLLKAIIIILLILLLFVVTTGIVVFVPLIQENSGSSSPGVGLQVDPFAGSFVEDKPASGVSIPGFVTLTIPAGTTTATTVDFYNPEKNEGRYYLTFKLSLLNKNGEVSETLYESGLLPPGEHIQTITLSRALTAGEYDAILHIQPYRIEDKTPTNNANMRITITVK